MNVTADDTECMIQLATQSGAVHTSGPMKLQSTNQPLSSAKISEAEIRYNALSPGAASDFFEKVGNLEPGDVHHAEIIIQNNQMKVEGAIEKMDCTQDPTSPHDYSVQVRFKFFKSYLADGKWGFSSEDATMAITSNGQKVNTVEDLPEDQVDIFAELSDPDTYEVKTKLHPPEKPSHLKPTTDDDLNLDFGIDWSDI